MTEKETRLPLSRIAGIAFLLSPILLQIPFAILTAQFDYPHILRQTPEAILDRYAAAMPSIVPVWYSYALAIVPALMGMALLPAVARAQHPGLLAAATPFGIASGVLQMAGLLRWVFAVPFLAEAYARAAEGSSRAAVVLVFQAQHQLLGVLLGEHLGQLFLSIWTTGVAVSLARHSVAQKLHLSLGIASALLFFAGLGDSLATVFPGLRFLSPAPAMAFSLWSVWCCVLGVRLLRGNTGRTFNRQCPADLDFVCRLGE